LGLEIAPSLPISSSRRFPDLAPIGRAKQAAWVPAKWTKSKSCGVCCKRRDAYAKRRDAYAKRRDAYAKRRDAYAKRSSADAKRLKN